MGAERRAQLPTIIQERSLIAEALQRNLSRLPEVEATVSVVVNGRNSMVPGHRRNTPIRNEIRGARAQRGLNIFGDRIEARRQQLADIDSYLADNVIVYEAQRDEMRRDLDVLANLVEEGYSSRERLDQLIAEHAVFMRAGSEIPALAKALTARREGADDATEQVHGLLSTTDTNTTRDGTEVRVTVRGSITRDTLGAGRTARRTGIPSGHLSAGQISRRGSAGTAEGAERKDMNRDRVAVPVEEITMRANEILDVLPTFGIRSGITVNQLSRIFAELIREGRLPESAYNEDQLVALIDEGAIRYMQPQRQRLLSRGAVATYLLLTADWGDRELSDTQRTHLQTLIRTISNDRKTQVKTKK